MPTEEVFYKNMSNPNYRKTLYKGLQEKGFDTESENDFQVSWHNKFANDPNYKGSGEVTSKPVTQQPKQQSQSSQRMLSGQRVPKQQHIERVETTRSATPKAVALYTPNTKSQIKTNEDVALKSQPKPKIERPKVDNTEQATKLKSSIETQQDEIKAKIEDAERRRMEAVREYNKKNRFLSAFVASAQQDAGVDPFESGAYGEEVTKITEEIQSLRNQLKRMTDAHDKIATALETKKGDGLFDLQNFKNIGRGIADTFTDADFWDMGRGEFNANTQMMGISKKIEQGKELTDDELNVVSAELINQSVDQYIQSIGGLPIGYSVGQVTAEATRFMLEMGINPARGASSAITRQLVKKFGVDGIKNVIAKRLATGAIKAVGNVAEAGALVNTVQSMRTAGDAAKRYAGTIDINNEGNLIVVDNQGIGEAAYKAEASAIIQNVTELMGGGKLAELTNKGFNAAVKRLGDVISLGKISDFAGKMSATSFGRFVDGMAKRGAWQGFADEVFEEEYGIMLNSLLVGDSSFSDLVDPKQQAEIVLGCAFMDGSIKAIKIGGGAIEYRNISKKYRKAESKAKSLFTPEQWEMISSNLGGATDAEMGAMLATYLDPNTGLSPEQRQAVAEYAGSMVRYRGFNRMADNAKEESKQQSSVTTPTLAYEVDSDVSLIDDNGDTINGHITGVDEDGNYIVETNTLVNGMRVQPMSADQLDAMGNTNGGEIVDGVQTSTAEGYDITDFDQIGELSMLVDNSRDDVAQALGTTDVDAVLQQALGNNPTDTDIDAQFGDNAQVVKEYVHNRAKLNGARQRNDDDLDIAIESIDSDIANIANTNGNVVAAKLVREDGDVYVVDGNIVTYEDGQIDVANSDASVIIQKADGSREMVTPLQLQDIASTPIEQYRDELMQAFIGNHLQAYDDAVNGALDYSQGQQYTMLNADGSTTDVTILADNGDGNVTVTARDGNKEGGVTDGKQIVLPKSQIQQGVREFKRNQLRGETAQQASIPQAEAQPTEVAEPTQEPSMPTDEQGNILYEQMDADSAWDALLAETGGDADMAMTVANEMIADKTKAVEEASKMVAQSGATPQEKIANLKAVKQAQAQAQAELDAWKAIAETPTRRMSLQTEQAEQTESQGQQVADKLPASEEVTTETPTESESTPQVGLVEDARTRTLGDKTRKMLDAMAKRLGLQVEFVDEIVTGKDEKGRNLYANAVIVGKNVKIAWHNRNRAIDFLLGHEFTHRMQDLSPEAYAEFVEAAKQALGEEEWNKRIKRMRDIYKSQGKTISEQGIIDEVVADYAGELVEERGVFDNFVERNNNNRSLLSKIADVLRSIKEFFSVGKQRKINNAIKQLNNLIEASEQALPGYLEAEQARDQIEAETGAKPRLSISATMIGSGFDAFAEDGKSPILDEYGNVAMRLGDKMFSARNLVSAKDIKGQGDRSPLNMMINDSLELGKIDSAKADEMYEKVADILNSFLVAGSAQKGGYANMAENWLWLGETVYRTIATNGDSQYKYSADITRVCKKNEAVIRSISALQKKVGYGITPGQIMDIYYQTSQKGYQVPCPVCYVFSRYMHNGKYATAAINGMRKYGEHLQGGNDPWTAEQWVEEYNRLVDIKNDKKNVNALKNATADVTTTLDKMDKLAEHVDRLGAQLATAINKGDVEKQEKIRATIQLLDARYRAALNVISQQSLTNWIKMFAIEKRSGETLNEFAEEKATTSEKGGYLNPNEWRIREDNQKPTDIKDFEEHALDLRRSAETMGKYPAITRLRKSGGSAAGKAIAFESNNEVGEFISGLNTSDPENATNWYMEAYNNPDNTTYRKKAKERFAKSVVYAGQQSLRGGQRMWTWSDYIESLGPDVVMNLLQLELLGGALQTYSKQLEGNNLVARMEGYVNGSLMAHGNGVVEVSEDQIEVKNGKEVLKDAITETIQENTLHDGVKERTRTLAEKGSPIYTDKNGKKHVLTFDDVVGIDPHGRVEGGARKKGLFDINRNLNRSGNILVGMNDTHIKTALADPRIFFVIPWHASGQSNHILSQMLNILGVNTRNFTPMDYTNMQSEKDYNKKDVVLPSKVVDLWERIKTQSQAEEWGDGGIDSNAKGQLTDSQKNYRRLRAEIFDGKYDSLSAEDKALIDNDAFLSQVKDKVSKVASGKMTNDDNNHIYPYEYWDEASTYEKADINGKRYLEYCRRLGFRPKFSGKWDKGDKWSSDGDFTQDKGYWKLLVDRRMYDVDGNFQGLTPVSVSGYSTELTDPKHNAKEFVTTQVADDQGAVDIANEVYEAESKRTEKGMPQVDYNMDMSAAVAEYNKLPKVKAGERTLIREAQTEAQKSRFSLTDLTEEEQKIVDEAKANGTYLKAPNGKASNLNERQWIQVRTKAFKDWFGDWENDPENASKVVDENGEPKVVYHGTAIGGFSIFGKAPKGIYFTDSRKAIDDYAWNGNKDVDNYFPFDPFADNQLDIVNKWLSEKDRGMMPKGTQVKEENGGWRIYLPDGTGLSTNFDSETMMMLLMEYATKDNPEFEGKGVYSTLLNMKNPFIIDAESKSWSDLPKTINGITIPEKYMVVHQKQTVSTDEWAEFLQSEEGRKLGFDGMIIDNVYDSHTADGTITDYIAFEPTQIKSATDNVGTFDASNPDIRYSLFGGNSGYVGYSMSKRAARAREEGRYPKTDFRKEYGVTAKSFDELVDAKIIASGEWHHTSKFGNETKFYHWDEDYYADIYEENKAVIDKLSRERKTDEIVSLFENHPLAHKAEYDNETERLVDDVNREYNDKIREVENEKRDKERAYNSAVFDALGQLTNVVKTNNGNLWFNASNGVGIQIDSAGNEVSMNYGGANGSKGALRYEARNELQTAIESVAKESNIESADATYYTDKVNQLNAERAERVAQLVEAREKEYTPEARYSLASDMARDEQMQSLLKNTPLWNDVAKTMTNADDYTIAVEALNRLDEDAVNSAKEAIDNANGVFAKADATDVANRLERALQMMRSDENAEVSEGESQQMRYSLRTKPEPKKTIKVYKLFNVDENGNPQALFIDAANSLETGVWYDADSPTIKDLEGLKTEWSYLLDNEGNVVDKKPLKRGKGGNFVGLPSKAEVNKATQEGQRWMTVSTSKSGEKAYHTVGINGAGGVSTYALRPGWHATNVPSARHIGVGKDGANAKYRGANQRWFEIEISADVDYNEEARERYLKAHPTYSREKAYSDLKGDIPERIPEDGYYNFKTNSNANPNQDWYIAGAIKIVRPLTEEEGRKISRSKGIAEDLPYKDGVKNFDDTSRYSLIGEQGATALDKSEEATHRMDNLAVAREMEADGKDAKAIRMATGWERGADGKWRYEIEDLKLKDTSWVFQSRRNLTLGDIIQEDELLTAYPQLADLKIKKVRGTGASFYEGTIEIGTDYLKVFLKSSNPDMVAKWQNDLRRTLGHEIQHAIQRIEGFARGGSSSAYHPNTNSSVIEDIEEKTEELNKLIVEYNETSDSYKLSSEGQRRYNQIIALKKRLNKEKSNYQLGEEGYRRLAGEVEARNAEKRMDYTPEQRRETLLRETEDVAREDQIFLMKNGGVNAQAKPEKGAKFSLQGGRSIADKYEKKVNTKGKGGAMHLSKFNFMEAWQDEMRALKEVQRIIEQEYGIVLESYEDAYMAENAMSSIAKASWDRYIKEVYEPMMRIHDEWIRSGESNESINHYLIAKSGLERNREFTVRDAFRAERASMEEPIRDAYRSAIKDLNEKYKPMELDLLNQYRSGAIDKNTYRNERKNLSDAKKAERKPIDDKYQLDMQDLHNKMTQVEEEYKAKRNALRDALKTGNIDFAEFCRLSDELALQYSGAEEIADYSGLTALAKMHGSKDWQGFAEQMVRDFEAKHSNTDVMWEHINNNTKSAVDYSYKSGVTSKQAKEHLDQMFLWYVPMKGNADVEAEDIYTYVNDKSSSFTPTVARAKGHTKYVSEDVMALIANTMQSAILQGERNKVKQKFLNMVQNYPTDLFSVDNGWVELQGNDWVEVFPDINENDTPEEVRTKIEDFQEKMQELANEGKAKRKKEALSLGVPFRATQNKSEHAISVMRNGEKMTIYVNGNPRVAQAINGKLKDTKESLGMRMWHTFTRWLSAGMTGYSIDFTGANLSRDTHHSSAIMFLKYGFKEQIRYILNGFADLPALIRGISGKSGNSKRDAYFQEFLANGGETGYANLRSLDDWKVENKRRIGRLRTMGGRAWGHTRNVLPYIAEAFGYINRLAETSSRFNAYVRARERNQDVATAVSEAKNITVNFNKKGSAKTAGAFGFLANLYRETMMFANPVIQGLYQFLKVGKEHKSRFTVLCLGHVALGGVVPILNQMLFELLGGDEEDEYYNQSEYQRRTNLLIYTGHGYIKIPLAPIFRELYALGDVFYGVIQKKIKMEDGAKDVVGLVRSMFSIEGQSAIDDDWSLVRFILPEQLSVVADISDNVNFMGMPIYKDSDYLRFDPEYQKVYKNAWSPLVATSAKLNELLGGDEDSAPRNANDKWLNPAIWQHVISSIGGGPLKTIGDILDISDRAISGEDLSISNIPVAKRFFMKPDERTLINAVNREYYDIKEDMAWVEDRVRKFNRKEYSGYAGYAEKLDFMYHSPDYLKYAIFEEGNKEIEKLDKKIKEEVDEKEIENLKAMSATKKDQLISKVNAVDRITETDSKDPLLAHYIGKDVAYKMRKRLKQAQIADVDNPGALSEYTQTPEFEIDMEIAAYVNQIAQIDYYLNDDLMRILTGQSRVQLEATKASLREALVELREAYEKRLKNKEEGEQ